MAVVFEKTKALTDVKLHYCRGCAHGIVHRLVAECQEDIVKGIENILCNVPMEDENGAAYKIYNIGNNKPEKLMDYIAVLEKCLGRTARKEYLPMQPGDVYETYADVQELMNDYGFKPSTTIEEGLGRFAEWFLSYYQYKN